MESQSLLTINNQSITFVEAIKYLHTTGDIEFFIFKILHQHLIEKELKSRDDIKIDSNTIEQAIVQLRIENQLVSLEQLDAWLQEKNMTYDSLHNQIEIRLKTQKLQMDITESKIEDFFKQTKGSLEQVVLSRIVVAEKNLAETLINQILEDRNCFGELARKYSLTGDRYANGSMGAVLLGQLPEAIKTQVAITPPGNIVGLIEVEGGYCILRIEEFIPANLDEPLKQQIRNQLFEQWLAEKLGQSKVELHIL